MKGKKYFHLTPRDLQDHPIWFRSMDVITFQKTEEEDWDDEPGLFVPIPDDPDLAGMLFENCVYYARARIRAANGTAFLGMLKRGAGDDIVGLNPTIITDKRQYDFYYGAFEPQRESLTETYQGLGLTAKELFPLTYELDCPVKDELPKGTVEGFCWKVVDQDREELQWIQ